MRRSLALFCLAALLAAGPVAAQDASSPGQPAPDNTSQPAAATPPAATRAPAETPTPAGTPAPVAAQAQGAPDASASQPSTASDAPASAAVPGTADAPVTTPSTPAATQTPDRTAAPAQAAPAGEGEAAAPAPEEADVRPVAVGLLLDTPPFSASERYGLRVGFDVDLAYGLCARIERTCRIATMDRDALLKGLHDRRIDLVIASDGRSDRIDSFANYSIPYLSLAARFVVPRHNASDAESASNRPYGAVVGTPYAQYLAETYKAPGAVALYASTEEMWIDLALGRLQGALAMAVTARMEFLSTPLGSDFRFSSDAISDESVRTHSARVAVRKGDTALLEAVNAALGDYLGSPEYSEALTRHLSGGLAFAPNQADGT